MKFSTTLGEDEEGAEHEVDRNDETEKEMATTKSYTKWKTKEETCKAGIYRGMEVSLNDYALNTRVEQLSSTKTRHELRKMATMKGLAVSGNKFDISRRIVMSM